MAVQKQDGLHTDVAESAVDLTGKEYRFCALDGTGKVTLAGNGTKISGVISEGKPAGKHTSFNTDGNPMLRVIAGGAINPGARVQSDAAGAAVAGLNNSFGRARLKAACAAGDVITVIPERFDADGA
jgi:hypothetical protein